MLEIRFDGSRLFAEEDETVDKLKKNFFGEVRGKRIELNIEEALYIMNFQNAKCFHKNKELDFNRLASHFLKNEKRLFLRYNAYRDWRDRGLVIQRLEKMKGKTKKSLKKYPSKKLHKLQIRSTAYWYPESFFSVIVNKEEGKRLFNDYWLGQYGIYKQDRGSLLKLNFFETVFLSKHFNMRVIDNSTGSQTSWEEVLEQVTKKREYTSQLWNIYEDWRLRSYVVKTGFKFGSHFRIYFPGAGPNKGDKWVHSKHVLHVFPKEERLLISEWARAVRVAHGVKKTFLLGLPEMTEKDHTLPESYDYFLAYRRKKVGANWIRETPEDKPRYLLVSVSEDEHIGGVELASLLKQASDMGLELILSISDRETSITYYVLKKVILPDSKYEYYEIEWMKP
jgi:tRNA-intron endonuclease